MLHPSTSHPARSFGVEETRVTTRLVRARWGRNRIGGLLHQGEATYRSFAGEAFPRAVQITDHGRRSAIRRKLHLPVAACELPIELDIEAYGTDTSVEQRV